MTVMMKMKTGEPRQLQYKLSKVSMKRIYTQDKEEFLITQILFYVGITCNIKHNQQLNTV